eukprot:6489297-Amphidinium_carterae.1
MGSPAVKLWKPYIPVECSTEVVATCVVAPNGVRLGKGKGYGEVEWGILTEIGAVEAGSQQTSSRLFAKLLNVRQARRQCTPSAMTCKLQTRRTSLIAAPVHRNLRNGEFSWSFSACFQNSKGSKFGTSMLGPIKDGHIHKVKENVDFGFCQSIGKLLHEKQLSSRIRSR